MSPSPPSIYVFHGDDEYTIWREVRDLKDKLGETTIAELNTITLDGSTISLDDLQLTACAIPFFNDRRLVILRNPLAMMRRGISRDRFLALLEAVPQSTALILIEEQPLTDRKMKKEGKVHWLEEWALKNTGRVYLKKFVIPRGSALVQWVIQRAAQQGGSITHQAAEALVSQVGEDNRVLDLELAKLLEYVDYARNVDVGDVELLTMRVRMADIFNLTDAIGARNRKQAMDLYHDLVSKEDAKLILAMIVRHFRILILTREFLRQNLGVQEITRLLRLPKGVVENLVSQARQYSQEALDDIYRKLLEVDILVKSSQLDLELGIDLLIVDGLPEASHFVPYAGVEN